MATPIQLEVCIESVESARAAEQGGATRVELCSALSEGGITPSAGLIALVRRNLTIPLHVLIRPRVGDFAYSSDEFEVIQRDIMLARQLGANGVALGILHPDRTIDLPRTRALVQHAAPMEVTFHRAFDFARDPAEALEAAIATGASRILTSGGAPTAAQGSAALRELVLQAGSRIAVMAAGKIREHNVADLLRATGIHQLHANLAVPVDSPVAEPNPNIPLGTSSDFVRTAVSPEAVAAFLRAASASG